MIGVPGVRLWELAGPRNCVKFILGRQLWVSRTRVTSGAFLNQLFGSMRQAHDLEAPSLKAFWVWFFWEHPTCGMG